MVHFFDMYQEIQITRKETEFQNRLVEHWEWKWQEEYSENIELLPANIELKRQYEGIPEEILAIAQGNTFTKDPEKAQKIETARAQVKGFHAKKWSAPSESQSQEQGDQGRPLFKVGRGANGVKFWGHLKKILQEKPQVEEDN